MELIVDGKKYILLEYIGDYGKMLVFFIIWNDIILYEMYFDGYVEDGLFYFFFFVAKLFVFFFVGFVVQEGVIVSVDDFVMQYLFELKDRDEWFSCLIIEYLFNMCSGLDYNENSYFNFFVFVVWDYYGW